MNASLIFSKNEQTITADIQAPTNGIALGKNRSEYLFKSVCSEALV